MTDNDIMEELSKKYLETIGNHSGYFNQVGRDYGTDMTFRKAVRRDTRNRLLTSGRSLDIQLKSVLEHNVNLADGNIVYALESKNYNDLVERSKENGVLTPLILVVFVLPGSKQDWVSVSPNELILKKCAYWYKINPESELTPNTESKTIYIPSQNFISSDFFDSMFNSIN